MANEHIFEFDEIAIGHSFWAVSSAYKSKIPLILNSNQVISPFARGDIEDFNDLPATYKRETCKVIKNGEITNISMGPLYRPAWCKLIEIMAIAGYLPFSGRVSGITVEEEKKLLKIATIDGRLLKAHYKTLYVFDDRNVKFREITPTGINMKKKVSIVTDWGKTLSGNMHDIDCVWVPDDEDFGEFLIQFYPRASSSRIRDFAAIFLLDDAKIQHKDYSLVFTRFKLEEILEKNSFPTTKVAKGRVRIEMMHREHKPKWRNLYESVDGIMFPRGGDPFPVVYNPLFAKLEKTFGNSK